MMLLAPDATYGIIGNTPIYEIFMIFWYCYIAVNIMYLEKDRLKYYSIFNEWQSVLYLCSGNIMQDNGWR